MCVGHKEAVPDIVKPASFKTQNFRRVVLENGIEFVLVSDAELDKAGAAIDVRVGSLSDPLDTPGLAHFCEHMLFYASAKYPEEDAYSKFVSEHGGHTNAYTSSEDTNYHFEVNWEALEDGLDRFAQFFISPLISADGVDREVNAVDSEHNKNLNTDAWRKIQLWRHVANPQHPINRFATGNLQTLLHTPKAEGRRPHEEVRKFYAGHYSSNIMKGAVMGRHSLDELEAMVRAKFQGIGNADLRVPEFTGDVVLPGQTAQIIRMVPEKEGHIIDMQWAIPPQQPLYRASPCGYLGHLLGHEGSGSILAHLKEQGWATSLSAGEGSGSFSARSFFNVRVTLTDEGFDHVQEIANIVFDYIRIVTAEGVTAERFQEYQDLAQLRFNFADKASPFQMVQALSSQLQEVPAEDVLLSLHHVPQEFDEGAVRAVLEGLAPWNLRVMWASKRFKGRTKEVEPWYSTDFSQEPVPNEWLSSWLKAVPNSAIHLPKPNPFISSAFGLIDVKDGEEDHPRIGHSSPLLTLWEKPSTRFETPKAIIYLHFACPEAYTSPVAAVLTRLYVKLLNDYLNETAYDAELAGLSYGLSNTQSGFLLSFYGYNHKLMELVHVVLKEIGDFAVRDDRFMIQKEAAAKQYANMRYDQPYQAALFEMKVLLEAQRWHTDEYEAVIGGLDPGDLAAFVRRLTCRCKVTGFATGNLDGHSVKSLAADVEAMLKNKWRAQPPFASQLYEKRVGKLQQGAAPLFSTPGRNGANENSAVVIAFQTGPDDLRRNALVSLLVQCTKREAFHTLRTVEQLGYMVWLSSWSVLTVRNVAFIIQSAAFSAEHLESRVDAFVGSAAALLEAMPQEEFASQVEELVKSKLEKPKKLLQLAAREWKEIDDNTLVFNRQSAEVAELKQLAKSDLTEFFQEAVHSPVSRRTLAVHVHGNPKQPLEQAAGVSDAESSHVSDGLTAAAPTGAVLGGAAEHGRTEPIMNGGSPADAPAVAQQQRRQIISDPWSFKRSLEMWPSPV
ncbi:hypothetical protein CVIRNUC_010443 [Coccomyxa viridis]|uniref:Insulin-degrading enzyme n=1 Tax=Coccomyxa viridis TaxID=1274662 RepID=A0AAV1ILX0_9CHLO|nr:hypothetical protein CVIRNUC_010443 [Coccomyxa viridis]